MFSELMDCSSLILGNRQSVNPENVNVSAYESAFSLACGVYYENAALTLKMKVVGEIKI